MTTQTAESLALEVDEVAKTYPNMAEVSAMLRSQAAEIETLHLININHVEQRCKYVAEIERLTLERDIYQKAAYDLAAEERAELYKEIQYLQNQCQPRSNY